MRSKTQPSTEPPRLLPERAFIVQLQSGPAERQQALAGRVENIATGQQRFFSSARELTEFLESMPPSRTED